MFWCRRRPQRPFGRVAIAGVAVLGMLGAGMVDGVGTAIARPRPPAPTTHVPVVAGKQVDPKLGHRISVVSTQLDQLARENDRLDEQYNVAAATARARQRTAVQDQHEAQQAAARYEAAHRRFVVTITQQYETGSDPTVGTLLTKNTPERLLNGLDLADYLASQFATTTRAVQSTAARAAAAVKRARAALVVARSYQAALARQKAALEQQREKFAQLLDSLTARQRREVARARAVAAAQARAALLAQQRAAAALAPSSPGAVSVRDVPAAVRRVVSYAQSQVGKPYVFGAAGPTTYDCSGLTMQAWAQVGVALPHSAAEQYGYGTHVAYGQLQPGDLIFLYSPIEHVELYVGDDLAVSAADPALGIIYVHPSDDLADYAGATRLTG